MLSEISMLRLEAILRESNPPPGDTRFVPIKPPVLSPINKDPQAGK